VGTDHVIDLSSTRVSAEQTPDTDSAWLHVGKFAPPQQRVTAARRDALLARLDAALNLPLSLIVSPAGFGKTTLLTQWWQGLQERGEVSCCWLSLDELDTDASRLVAGLILAVSKAGVDVGAADIAARQQLIDADIRPILAAMLVAIRKSSKRVVIILDDYHRACSPAVEQVVETLVEHGHGSLHVAISGRNKPTFQISALFARGLVLLLDASDLALSISEASQIIGPDVSEADLALLHLRTEGWAVALQFTRLWLERGHHTPESLRKISGRTVEMTEYLAEQVVQDMPADLREFLLEMSLIERFSPSLADAVRERSDSAELLERLRPYDALLVPLDVNRDWYRFHSLFADFLTQRLHRGPPGRAATLHRRAARWLSEAGDAITAVKYALKAGDAPLAVEITQAAGGWEAILRRGIGYVRSLLNCFSDIAIRSEPVLQLTQAYLDIKLANYDAATDMLALTRTLLETASPKIRRDFQIIAALLRVYVDDLTDSTWVSAIDAQVENLAPSDHLGRGALLAMAAIAELAAGNVARTETASRRAIQEMRASGSILGTNYCFFHLAQSQLLRGQLRDAESLCREAMKMAEENYGADSGLKGLSGSFLAYCLYLRNDLEGSSQILDPSLESIETGDGWFDVFAVAYAVAVSRAYRSGGLEAAMQMITRASATARVRKLERLSKIAAAWRVEYLSMAGYLKEARREAQAGGIVEAAEVRGKATYTWRTRYAATSAIAHLRLASGASAQALALIEGASQDFRDIGLLLPAHQLDAIGVMALNQRGSACEAIRRLEALLGFIVEEGAIRVLLDQGPRLETLLHVAQRRNREMVLSGAQREIIAQLLVDMRRDHPRDHDGFGARELEVLRELCNGRSNKAIGQMLDLSANTVKFHLKRLFRKLDVDSRAAAISAGLQRGLVEIPKPDYTGMPKGLRARNHVPE